MLEGLAPGAYLLYVHPLPPAFANEVRPGNPVNLENHSGNGIVVDHVRRCTIEYCEAFNNGWDMPRKGNGPVGIWGWEAHRLTIQFCISHDNKTQKGAVDGGGFEWFGNSGTTSARVTYNFGGAVVIEAMAQRMRRGPPATWTNLRVSLVAPGDRWPEFTRLFEDVIARVGVLP